MILPNFLIIGAAKAGTSAIYHYLTQHPQVFMPKQKELRYFSSIDNPEINGPNVYKYDYVHTLEEYKLKFSNATNAVAIGEASPQYLYYPQSAKRIHEIIPNIKIVAILRNPIERAYSSYLHAVRDWHETELEFDNALEKENLRIELGWPMLFHYVNAGFFHKQLQQFYSIFDKINIKVYIYDDIVSSPQNVISDLFSFLSVDSSFIPNLSIRPNISGYPKNKNLYDIYKFLFSKNNLARSLLSLIIPRTTRNTVTTRLKHKNLAKVPMDNKIRCYLSDIFSEDIYYLQDLIDKDLSIWLEN